MTSDSLFSMLFIYAYGMSEASFIRVGLALSHLRNGVWESTCALIGILGVVFSEVLGHYGDVFHVDFVGAVDVGVRVPQRC